MPRHHRQRPAWLPSWIPYKDGRYLGLARQTILAWSSTILATAFFLMTVAYATEKSRFTAAKFVHSSRSNTIMVLRVLSEIAGVFLAGSVYSTFEVVQWVLISRPDGIRLPQFLALQSSTGPLGLLMIALGRGLPASQWPMKPRLMSLLRLLAQVAIPLTGVLVMSNVNTNEVYTPIQSTITPMAFGMEAFNGSIASQLGVMQDVTFNVAYVAWLSNPLHAIDVTTDSEKRQRNCANGVSMTNSTSCARKALITQEFQNVDASLPLKGYLDDQVLLALNQQIYSFEYHDNIDVANENLHCEELTSGPASYLLCARNADDGSIEAAMIPCPASLVTKKACAKDTSWKSSKGFTTSLHTAFLNATVSYDRATGRILSHTLRTHPIPTKIDAGALLQAMTVILDTSILPANASDTNPILGSPTHFFGRLVAGHMYRVSRLMQDSPEARIKGTNALQCILAMTLFYCQNGILSQTVLPFAGAAANATAVQAYSKGAFAKVDDNAYVALAQTRFRIQVGRATLLAYIVLGGITLFVCIVALVVGSLLELVKMDAEPTLWPALDFYTQCRVQDGNNKVVPAHRRVEMAWIHDGRRLFKEIEGLRVTRRKRGHGPAAEPGIELERVGGGDRGDDE